MRIVDEFIAIQDASLLSVIVRATIVMVVIAGRVVAPRLENAVVGDETTQCIEPLFIVSVLLLLSIVQTVQTYILLCPRTRRGGKGVCLCGLLWNLTPLGGGIAACTAFLDRHATLIVFLAVAQDILRHLTEVKIKVTRIVGGIALLPDIDKGVEHPELDIFDVRLLEVGGFQFTHHTAPLRLRLAQRTVAVQVARQVIGSSFLGIVGQVQHGQCRGSTVVGTLVAVGVEFLHIDLSHIVVGELFEVALDMTRRKGRGTTGEDGVYIIPCQSRTVITA